MCLLEPKCDLSVQFGRKLCYLLQVLIRYRPGHIVNGFVALVAENFQFLYQLRVCVDSEFQRLDDLALQALVDVWTGPLAECTHNRSHASV
jgi:hypothetical protein